MSNITIKNKGSMHGVAIGNGASVTIGEESARVIKAHKLEPSTQSEELLPMNPFKLFDVSHDVINVFAADDPNPLNPAVIFHVARGDDPQVGEELTLESGAVWHVWARDTVEFRGQQFETMLVHREASTPARRIALHAQYTFLKARRLKAFLLAGGLLVSLFVGCAPTAPDELTDGETGAHLGYWSDPDVCRPWGPSWLACPEPWIRGGFEQPVARFCKRRALGPVYCAPLQVGPPWQRRPLAIDALNGR